MEHSVPHLPRDQHSLNKEGGGDGPASLLSILGDVVVFGLEEREDRWQRCKEILKDAGVTEVTRFANTKKENVWKGITDDFLRVLKLKGHNDLMFFEDDFELMDNWREVLYKAWEDLPADWDLLYLGANLRKTPKRITKNIVKLRGAWCFHAVVINKNFTRHILKAYDPGRRQVIDEWLRIEADHRNFYMTYPMIAYQRKGYSDLVGKEVDYKLFLNKYYLQLR